MYVYVIRTFGGVLLLNPQPLHYTNVTWLTRDMVATTWKARDGQAQWKTRDSIATTWKARE